MRDQTMRVMVPFRSWLSEHGLGDLAEPVGSVLAARRDYGGRCDPTCWHSGEVHDLMARVVPARMADTGGLAEHGAAGLGAFLDFLADTDRLHPGSTHVKALKKELDRASAAFRDAMADPRSWRMAKTLYQAMDGEDVDIADEAAVQEWFGAFNEAGDERRRAVLGHVLTHEPGLLDAYLVARGGSVAALSRAAFMRLGQNAIPERFRPFEPETFPPVCLAAEPELVAAARWSTVLRQSAALVEWVGDGRAVDKKGRLPSKAAGDAVAFVADRSSHPCGEILLVAELLPLALSMQWIEMRRTGFVQGPAADEPSNVVEGGADGAEALRVWRAALDLLALPDATDRRGSPDMARMLELMERAESVASWAMTVLYEAREPIDFEDLVDTATVGTDLERALDDEYVGALVLAVVRTRFHSQWRHGALIVEAAEGDSGSAELLRAQGLEPWYAPGSPDPAFALSPLGMWGVREALLAEGNIAPADGGDVAPETVTRA